MMCVDHVDSIHLTWSSGHYCPEGGFDNAFYAAAANATVPRQSRQRPMVDRRCRLRQQQRSPLAGRKALGPGHNVQQSSILESPAFMHGEKRWLSADREDPHSPVPIDKMHEPRYPPLMKQLITDKLKLQTTPAQFQALRATQLAYRDALNHVSRYAYEHGKMSSRRTLQRDCYERYVASTRYQPKWLVMSRARWEPPTKPCGPKSGRIRPCAKQARQRNATRAWIVRLSTSLRRLPTTTIATTA